MARWSSRTFFTKWLSRDGVGFACGVGDGDGNADGDGCGAGETCADAQTDASATKARTKAARRNFVAAEIPLYMIPSGWTLAGLKVSLAVGRLREDYYRRREMTTLACGRINNAGSAQEG
jgi:hypothetical protein